MTEFVDPELEVLADLSKEVMEETPKLDAALKNLASILMGNSVTRSESDPGKPRSPNQVINSMKYLYKAINAQAFKESPQWGVDHPQGEEQSALDRIEQIKRYKVVKMLHSRVCGTDHDVQNNSKGKVGSPSPGKYFGKKFFTWAEGAFDEIKARAVATADKVATMTEDDKDALNDFVAAFEQSLRDDDAEYADLVWSTDFTRALQERQKARQEKVARQKEDEEAAKAQIKAMLDGSGGAAAAAGGGDGSDSRVEELPDAVVEKEEG
jgi:hypothetical protein